jgi:hypothetical protein
VSPGDHATFVLWQGRLTRLTADGVSEATGETPGRDATSLTLVLGLYSSVYTLAAFAYVLPFRRGEDAEAAARRRQGRFARLWPFSCILAVLGLAVYGTLSVVATPTPVVLSGAFVAAMCLSAGAVVVVRPGLPPLPRRPMAQLPSATTPYE